MTITGAGGAVIKQLSLSPKFEKQYKKLPPEIKAIVPEKLNDLLKQPFPAGLKFEKLKGYHRPDIYTIHVNGNYKISFEIEGVVAKLRCVGNHNDIDRRP
jgi:mRNA-degrading endonuclease RelE of RelBE toxin-antitoxin system